MRTIAFAAVFAAGLGAGLWAGQTQPAPSPPAERVTGIGGVFFKAKDPKTLRTWYQEKLGITMQDGADFGLFLWRERQDSSREGTTVWGLFPETTKYFAPSSSPFMINYRVRNLETLLTQLRSAGLSEAVTLPLPAPRLCASATWSRKVARRTNRCQSSRP